MPSLLFSLLTSLAVPAVAWLPGEHRDIYAHDGANLFNASAVPPAGSDKRWLSESGKIRGVNMGSLFVMEPWMVPDEWEKMGCGNAASEWDCVSALGQSQANTVFQSHWGSWITQSDISEMQSYGLNTIRIPVGYWMDESLVYADSEHFPQGGLHYLSQLCGWASDAGFYIIIDMHGAPGAQVAANADTGQYASSPGFYVDSQYDRGTGFLGWLAGQIHTDNNMRNVGMIGIVNEPVQNADQVASMRSYFYPNAYTAIRNAESALNITANDLLHVEPMNELWGAGDPNQYLGGETFLAYDDHRYLKYDTSVTVSQAAYLAESCHANRNSDNDTPTIVGEFSLSPPSNVQDLAEWSTSTQSAFYKQWFAAQVSNFESTTNGWIFWCWKAQLGDYRWSYQEAVTAGVIPSNITDAVNEGACNGI